MAQASTGTVERDGRDGAPAPPLAQQGEFPGHPPVLLPGGGRRDADLADGGRAVFLPKYRELWKHLKESKEGKAFCALRGKAKADAYDPRKIPNLLHMAINVLYDGYRKVFDDWKTAGCKAPPCFIIVCQNTAISKIVYQFVSGFDITDADGSVQHVKGACELFDNYDEEDQPLSRPHTLLIDSTQLESGEALADDFRVAAAAEIETFKRELRNRGEVQKAENLSDEDILREVVLR